MNYIIVGLGNFGASLAEKLTAEGHEVIGIDDRMQKVELLKERITHTICMDATDEQAVAGLPISNTDVVIVAIGEEQGANILITALFKNLGARRLISRAINPLHEKVLQAIGVTEIVHPEEETAERWAKKLCLANVEDSFELDENYSIVEATVPDKYSGKTIMEVQFRTRFNLLVLTTIKRTEEKSLIGRSRMVNRATGVIKPDHVLEAGDTLVLFGSNQDLQNFLNLKFK